MKVVWGDIKLPPINLWVMPVITKKPTGYESYPSSLVQDLIETYISRISELNGEVCLLKREQKRRKRLANTESHDKVEARLLED